MSPTFSPISLGGIGKATVTGTTGSPNIDTTSRAGKTIYNFTGSGSITIGTAGTAEFLIIGGGGGGSGNAAGGGAGGFNENLSAFLPAGTLTVTVGAGGATNYQNRIGQAFNGFSSVLGPYVAVGGGAGGNEVSFSNQNNGPGIIGGSGGGGAEGGSQGQNCTVSGGGVAVAGQGNSGGTGGMSGNFGGGGGGGGAGGAGSGFTSTRSWGGAEAYSSITGSSVAYASGGGGRNSNGLAGSVNGVGGGGTANNSGTTVTNGAANSGGGAGATSITNGIGGSGRVIVVIG